MIPSVSAVETVRINEVNAQVGQNILYELYVQTGENVGILEGSLSYDNSVLKLADVTYNIDSGMVNSTSVHDTVTSISFSGSKNLYDTKTSKVAVFTAVFSVINTSSKYTSYTSSNAITGCLTNLKSTSGDNLIISENTNISTRTIIAATSVKMSKDSVLLTGKGDSETVKVLAIGPVNNNVDSSFMCTYVSNDTKVATVSKRATSVTITAVGPGTCYIKCVPDGRLTSTYIKVTVVQSTQKITAKSYTKTYGSKAFSLGAKSSGDGKLTYSSSDKKVATVSSKGVVTVKGCGKATITIKASATSKYKSASKKITITVKPTKLKITGYKGSKLMFTPQSNVSGYEVKIAKVGSNFRKNLKLSSKSKYLDLKKYSKGDYKIQIRAYKKVSKSTYYGAWGKCQLTLR